MPCFLVIQKIYGDLYRRRTDIVGFVNGIPLMFIELIFPRDYCLKQGLNKNKWNSIVNKTPISASSNREIGGSAPSVYLVRLEKKGPISKDELDGFVETHWIDPNLLRTDRFNDFIIDRARKLLRAIETATGRTVSGKDSDEVVQAFGEALGDIDE